MTQSPSLPRSCPNRYAATSPPPLNFGSDLSVPHLSSDTTTSTQLDILQKTFITRPIHRSPILSTELSVEPPCHTLSLHLESRCSIHLQSIFLYSFKFMKYSTIHFDYREAVPVVILALADLFIKFLFEALYALNMSETQSFPSLISLGAHLNLLSVCP